MQFPQSDPDLHEEGGDDFNEDDCESDFEEQLVAARQLKRQKREERAAKEAKMLIPKSYLPSHHKKLSACIYCKFVLNRERWLKLEQCPNCPQSHGLLDTTENFSNLIGSVLPKVSWVA